MGSGSSAAGMQTTRPAGSAANVVLWRRGGAANKYKVVENFQEKSVSDRVSPKGGCILLEDHNFGCDMPLCMEIDADLQRDIQGAGSARAIPCKIPAKALQISTGLDEAPDVATGSWDDCLREKHPEWFAAFDLCATGAGDKMLLSGDSIRRALRRALPNTSDREVRVIIGDENDVGEITFAQFCRLAAALAGSGSPSGTAYSIHGLEKAREESKVLREKARKEIMRGLARQESSRHSSAEQESTPSEGPTEIMQQAEDLLADMPSDGVTEIVNQAEAVLMESHIEGAQPEATEMLLAAQRELAAQMEVFGDAPAEVMVVHPGIDETPITSQETEAEDEELAYAPYELPDLPNLPAHLREPVPTERPVTAESYAKAATMMDQLRKNVLNAARIGTLGRALAVLHLVHPRQWKCEEACALESITEEGHCREPAVEAADVAMDCAVKAGSVECPRDTSLIAGEASILQKESLEEPVIPPLLLSSGSAKDTSSGKDQVKSARNSARRTPRVGPPPPLPPFRPPADYAVTATPRDKSARGPTPQSARGPTPRAGTPVAAPGVPPPPPPVPVAVLSQGSRKQTPRSARGHADWVASSQSRWGSVLDGEDPAVLLSARRIHAGMPNEMLKASLQPAETVDSPAIAVQ